jgi:hypothetical protein
MHFKLDACVSDLLIKLTSLIPTTATTATTATAATAATQWEKQRDTPSAPQLAKGGRPKFKERIQRETLNLNRIQLIEFAPNSMFRVEFAPGFRGSKLEFEPNSIN